MNLTQLDYEFDLVDHVDVRRNEDGRVVLYMPQQDYAKAQTKPVHQYGWGPFCELEIDTSEFQETPGVYLFAVDGNVRYIGETIDLDSRIQQGYSHISPANCFEGGQQTNCRINHNLFSAARDGDPISLWFRETTDHQEFEQELCSRYDPLWNRTTPEQTTSPAAETEDTDTFAGKYGPLYATLDQANTNRKEFTFDEINDLLDDPLPPSAYDHRAWWRSHGGHSHAQGWESRGWTVDTLDLEAEEVVFLRTDDS